jgi:hypothetical protein
MDAVAPVVAPPGGRLAILEQKRFKMASESRISQNKDGTKGETDGDAWAF